MKKLFRLWHTVRHLRLSQIIYQCYYRFVFRTDKPARLDTKSDGVAMPVKKAERGQLIPLPESISAADGQLAPTRQFFPPARFEFLNLAYEHPAANLIDWNYDGHGKLWTYNQNYFEFLRHPELSIRDGENLIIDWIRQSENHRDGWEPYPTSLRIVHWLQFFRERKREVFPLAELSLRRQYNDLWRKREYHLGGNHLLENAIALCLGAVYFREENQFRRASILLTDLLEEQYTQDGGHYERSPMYHCILLWRLLDLYSWKSTAGQHQLCYFTFGDRRKLLGVATIKSNLARQVSWMKSMLNTQGNYPNFNDSTNGIAPRPQLLLDYAHKLGITAAEIPLSDSGYRHWQTGEVDLWIDAGPIGPDHIPGHAHADNLTFVMARNGKKVIVDPGISTYEKNERRHWERSTSAHNTVTIDDKNSSDVWAGFRVGKRALTSIETDQDQYLKASHDGYSRTHRREFTLNDRILIVKDEIGNLAGTARFHLAPGITVDRRGENSVAFDGFTLTFGEGVKSVGVSDYQCCSGFNLRNPASCIVVKFSQTLRSEICWTDKAPL